MGIGDPFYRFENGVSNFFKLTFYNYNNIGASSQSILF